MAKALAVPGELFDFRSYVAMRKVKRLRPPYQDSLEVTPLSIFSENEWIYPEEALPSGHRDQNKIAFLSLRRVIGRKRFRLCPGKHELLLRQLKECVFGLIFHRHLLPWRADAIRAMTIIHKGHRLALLFANFAAAGLTSLQALDQEKLSFVFSNLPVSPKSLRQFVADFRDLMILADNGLISHPFSLADASIELPEIADEIDKASNIRTLHEPEIALLLAHSRTYIERVEEIAEQVISCRNGDIEPIELVDWAYDQLPVSEGLWPRDIVSQLGWLVRMAVYQLIVFHLGSRSSEALSATEDAIRAAENDETKFAAFITLTIFKGNKSGQPRTYPVHPFLLRVGKAATTISEALGHPSRGLIFRKGDSNREIGTNTLNHRLRNFASMHGLKIRLSSHSWRFSVADIVAGSAENPFPAIQYQLGHEYLSEAIGYGLHGPSGDEIRAAAVEAGARSVDIFLTKCAAGGDLGGVQGSAIAAAFEGGAKKEELRDQMTTLGVTALRVGTDRFCVKQAHAKGACSTSTRDAAPEVEHCQADCIFQAQFSSQRDEWINFLKDAKEYYFSNQISVFDKIRKTNELRQHIIAWPELNSSLDEALRTTPSLAIWFR
ncbi:hypothetical protein ACC676_08850 [Rhizobium ruizarguesonis]